MRPEEFFYILDDMDERIVSEIFEDVQQPQRITAMPHSPRKLPKIILGSAACLAVIAAAGLAVKFAVPGNSPVISGSPASGNLSENSFSANDSGSVSLTNSDDKFSEPSNWFSQTHLKPFKRTGKDNGTCTFIPESSYFVDDNEDWSPEDYEFTAVDDGTVVFAEKISDAYGSAIVIKHAEDAYIAYGGLDPDTVTVTAGDSVTAGEVLGNPKAFTCFDANFIGYIKPSAQPVTEEFFRSECEKYCNAMAEVKNRIDFEEHGKPDSDGNHHNAAADRTYVGAVTNSLIIYKGVDSDGSGIVVTLDANSASAFIVYKSLNTEFPNYYEQNGLEFAKAGEPIGYVGDTGDAYWFVLDNLEFEKFSKETGIDFYPTHITFKNTFIHNS